jgi:hypothetical protein
VIERESGFTTRYKGKKWPLLGDRCGKCQTTVCSSTELGFGKQTPYTWCLSCKRKKTWKTRSSEWGYLTYLFTQMRARSKAKKRECSISLQSLKDMWDAQNGCCALTGNPMTHDYARDTLERTRITNASVDRIDSSIGYVTGNVQLTCVRANLMKGPLMTEQLYDLCASILNHRDMSTQRHTE